MQIGAVVGGKRERRRFILGVGLSSVLGALGYARGALDGSGAAGAVLVGTPLYTAGGLRWSILLLAFFTSSSALSRFGRARKVEVAAEYSKGERRDLGQALANGGVAGGLAVLALARPGWPVVLAIAGALAEANADTWATELGTLSRKPPRLITTGRVVPAGTSGGVSTLGLGAAAGGALAVALPAALLVSDEERAHASRVRLLGAVTLAGLTGSLLDSIVGALWQAMYWCPRCETWTERRIHRCGTPTERRRGLGWLDNDVVNLMATLAGALLALMMTRLGERSPTMHPGR